MSGKSRMKVTINNTLSPSVLRAVEANLRRNKMAGRSGAQLADTFSVAA